MGNSLRALDPNATAARWRSGTRKYLKREDGFSRRRRHGEGALVQVRGIYTLVYSRGGRSLSRSLGTRNKRVANSIAKALTAAGDWPPVIGSVSLREVLDLELSDMPRRGCSLAWRKNCEYMAASICRIAGGDSTSLSTRDYESRRRFGGVSGQTIRKELQLILRGAKISTESWPGGFTIKSAGLAIRSNPISQQRRGVAVDDSVLRLFLAALTREARVRCEFVIMTGLRACEMRRIEFRDVEIVEGWPVPAVLTLRAEATKSRRQREVGLCNDALHIIEEKRSLAEGPLIFGEANYKKQMAAACRRLAIRNIHLRDLRSTFASRAIVNHDPVAVMRALGHRDLSTTERYLETTRTRLLDVATIYDGFFSHRT